MIKLCKYCGSEPQYNKLIYYKGMTFVTNGYYVLRFSGRLEGAADAKGKSLDTAACMESLFPRADEIAGMRHVSLHFDWAVTRCDQCEGRGIIKKCSECDGSGEVSFDNDYHTYEFECGSCEGYGVIWATWRDKDAARCSCCQGFGQDVDEERCSFARIGAARLSPDQIFKLSRLPLIAWAAHGIHGHFVFFGGEGVLLGCAQSREDYSK